MWHMVGGEHSLKISAPNLLRFGIDRVLKILNQKISQLIIQLMINGGDCRTAPATPGLLMNVQVYSMLVRMINI